MSIKQRNNDNCQCDSGLKYKKCCMLKESKKYCIPKENKEYSNYLCIICNHISNIDETHNNKKCKKCGETMLSKVLEKEVEPTISDMAIESMRRQFGFSEVIIHPSSKDEDNLINYLWNLNNRIFNV